jgi:translation initiation factor 3 subunit E
MKIHYNPQQTLIPYLDRHLALPLLAHLAELDPVIYPVEQVQKAQYELAKGTNLIDYAEQLADQVKHLDGVKQGLPGESPRCGCEH